MVSRQVLGEAVVGTGRLLRGAPGRGGGRGAGRRQARKDPVETASVCWIVSNRPMGGWRGLSEVEGASFAWWREAGAGDTFPNRSSLLIKIRN